MQNAKSLVPEEFEDQAEAAITRQELGSLITDLRVFINQLRNSELGEIDRLDIAEILEEIINGG